MTEPLSSEDLGGKVGGRIGGIVQRAVQAARAQTAPLHTQIGGQILENFFNTVSGEIRGTLGPVFTMLADHPDTPEQFQPLFTFLAKGNGQWQTFLGQSVAGSALSAGIGALFNNLLQPLTGRLIAENPHLPISVSDAAKAIATRLGDDATTRFDAHQQGIDDHRLNILTELSRARPAPTEVLSALNRGIIDRSTALERLTKLGYSEDDLGIMVALRNDLLAGPILADMVVRGVISLSDGVADAQRAGVPPADFQRLVNNTGEPLAVEQLLYLHRRGVIDDSRLVHGIHQSRIKDEWIDAVRALTHVPMSTADALRTAVQGNLSEQEAAHIAELNGLEPAHFKPLMETEGEPLGVQEMVTLMHKGVMTEPQVRKGIQESRYKNKYIDMVLAGAERLPEQGTIRSLYGQGAIDESTALRLLQQWGFSAEVAAAMLTEAQSKKMQKARDLSESQIKSLYRDRIIDGPTATDLLRGLGYSDGESAYILALEDMETVRRFQNTAISRVHSAYTKGLLSADDAQNSLFPLGVTAAQIQELLPIWELERTTVTRTLTEAQVVSAVKKGFLTPDQGLTRLVGMGYGTDDATILITPAIPPPAPTTAGA